MKPTCDMNAEQLEQISDAIGDVIRRPDRIYVDVCRMLRSRGWRQDSTMEYWGKGKFFCAWYYALDQELQADRGAAKRKRKTT